MTNIKKTALSLLASMPLLMACSSNEPEEETQVTPYKNIELTNQSRAVIGINNNFGLDLFKNCNHTENLTLSPYGAFSVLAMLANGDEGEARDEIINILGCGEIGIGMEAINEYCTMLNQELLTLDGQVDFRYANSIWTELNLRSDYVGKIKTIFDAEWIQKDPTTNASEVNDWISNKTSGFLKDVLEVPYNVTPLILNIAYFNGTWTNKFSPSETKSGVFTNLNDSKANVKFMSANSFYRTIINDEICMVEIPYGSGNFTMSLIKPAENNSFEGMIESLDSEFMNSFSNETLFKGEAIRLEIPKFSFESKTIIDGSLKKMGFDKVYNGYNNILADGRPFIPDCFQQCSRIEVDEEGTKVAVGTLIGETYVNLSSKSLKFDEPFIFIIRETSTNTILFIGEITDLT